MAVDFLKFKSQSLAEAYRSATGRHDTIRFKESINSGYRSEILDVEPLKVDISHLKLSDFGEFYLVDIFNGDSCTHGNKVYDVLKQLFKNYKIDSIISKVKRIPINYYRYPGYGDTLITTLREDAERDRPGEAIPLMPIDSESKKLYSKNDSIVPEIYLQALFHSIGGSKKRLDIVSTSFSTNAAQSYVGISIPNHNETTNWITAALNEALDVKRYNTRLGDRTKALYLEPIYSYLSYNITTNNSTIIVGCQIDTSAFAGMFGNFVTTLGRGNSWGLAGCTTCIQKSALGTSFATPEVAAKLFIAKAYWRKYNQKINPAEAKRRIILATNLKPSFVSKFASGGNVNINKLLQSSIGYLVTKSDSIIPILKFVESNIDYTDSSGAHGLKFGTSITGANNKQFISGLYIIDHQCFIYKNDIANEMWSEIPMPHEVTISINDLNNSQYEKTITTTEFKNRYKQFVLLK